MRNDRATKQWERMLKILLAEVRDEPITAPQRPIERDKEDLLQRNKKQKNGGK
jgi:hypothetical protein